jgi:predicted nucleic acid-binding Zn ribbon protein
MTCKSCGKPIGTGDYCSLKCKDTKKRAKLKSTKAKDK